jgi:hypothetical protein
VTDGSASPASLPHADVSAERWSAWTTWSVVLALAMLFGFIEAAQLRLGSSVLGQGMPMSVALSRVMPYWLIAACVMPLIVTAGRRFRIWHFLLRPNIPALAATATAFAVLALGGRALLQTVDSDGGPVPRPTPVQLFQTYFALDLLTYTAFVGTVYAFHYYREARRREITASRLQARLAEAHLRGLEARVDPDFLFNTLDDISTLAAQGQRETVIDMLGRLSEVLRAALNDARPDEIPLSRELELLDGYLNIESGPRRPLRVHRDVPHDALTALVPRMVLPALIEVVAGSRPDDGRDRRIAVRAAREDENLRIEVVAAGVRGWSSDGPDPGLTRVREMLHHLYGRMQSLELTRQSAGPSAVMTIPFRQALAGEERVGA